MTPESVYELKVKLPNGRTKIVTWTGRGGEDAARRYVDCHREHTVIATRLGERHGLFVLGGGTIIG
jgi:hypothetical protein